MADTARCFLAVELDEAIKRPLLRILREKLPRHRGVRWCHEKQLHVTLKFLGDVDLSNMPKLREIMKSASEQVEPFEIMLDSFGVFPRPESPRVFWCGVEDDAQGCRRWVEAADALLPELGIEPEARAYAPHITLGRSNSPQGSALMRDLLRALPRPGSPAMTVDHVVLFESRRRPTGAEYRPLHSESLVGGG